MNRDRQTRLELKIAASMDELRQLHLKPTLDDFQDFWRKKLEASLLSLRQELRLLEVEDCSTDADSAIAVA
jgi:hypothetical protein